MSTISHVEYESALAHIRALSSAHPGSRINGVSIAWDTDGYRVQGPYDGAGWSALMSAEEAARAVTTDTDSAALDGLIACIQHAQNELALFRVNGDPSGYGKANTVAWLGERVLAGATAVIAARARIADLEAKLAETRHHLERIDGSAPFSLSALADDFPHLAESVEDVRQYIEAR